MTQSPLERVRRVRRSRWYRLPKFILSVVLYTALICAVLAEISR